MTVAGIGSVNGNCTNIGTSSVASGTGASAFGVGAQARKTMGVALGRAAIANEIGGIQIGNGTNSTAGTLAIGLTTDGSNFNNYELLNSSGKVPTGRYIAMTGADGTAAGTIGAVPAPAATDNTKFLRGDGTWAEAGSAASYDNTTGTVEL